MAPPAWLKESVTEVPDFPKPGIAFKDLSPLWRSSSATSRCAVALAANLPDIDAVVGIEARGFLAGIITAQRLGVGFIAARKPGKLPGPVARQNYELEYGTDGLEIQQDAISAGDRILVVDDVVATGGTAEAVCNLVEQLGGQVVGVRAIIELSELRGRDRLGQYNVSALWEVGA